MKLIKTAKKAMIALIVIIIIIPFANRAIYGAWNIFNYPNRVSINGFRYDNDNDFITLTGDKKPKYEVSGIIDKITGKRIYTFEKNFKADFGTRVYLHVKGDKFLQLLCGGGA